MYIHGNDGAVANRVAISSEIRCENKPKLTSIYNAICNGIALQIDAKFTSICNEIRTYFATIFASIYNTICNTIRIGNSTETCVNVHHATTNKTRFATYERA